MDETELQRRPLYPPPLIRPCLIRVPLDDLVDIPSPLEEFEDWEARERTAKAYVQLQELCQLVDKAHALLRTSVYALHQGRKLNILKEDAEKLCTEESNEAQLEDLPEAEQHCPLN